MTKGKAHQSVHRLVRRKCLKIQLTLACADFGIGIHEHRAVKLFLVAKMMIEQSLVRLRALCDRINTRTCKTMFTKFHTRGCKDCFLGFLRAAWTADRLNLGLPSFCGHS